MHYGAYARRIKKRYSGYLQRSIKQTTFSNFLRKAKKWAPECQFCGALMKFCLYVGGPPKDVAEVDRIIT
ncbi:MAG: IS91-like element ISMbu9 family transposase, partial [Methanosarcinaceae archaeon]